MHFFTHLTIGLISLITIVLSCVLFTNAIEFLGNKIKLGSNATGSILAVLGTGLPETIVPIVAILNVGNSEIEVAQSVALGAILGSPFMLSTLAFFILLIVLIVKKRKTLNVDYKVALRDYKYFLVAYVGAVIFSINFLNEYKIIMAFFLIFLYFIFIRNTILKSRTTCIECECEGLYFNKNNIIKQNTALILQLILSLGILIISSHFFVIEINYFSNACKISPVILTFLIAPFATELPEIINSIIWTIQEKDDLAFANILGAIIFQSTVLFAMGMILTPWMLDKVISISSVLIIFCAFIFVLLLFKNKKIYLINLYICAFVYFIYLIILKIIN